MIDKYYIIVTNKYTAHHLDIFEEIWSGSFWFKANAQRAAFFVSNSPEVIREQWTVLVELRPKNTPRKTFPHR